MFTRSRPRDNPVQSPQTTSRRSRGPILTRIPMGKRNYMYMTFIIADVYIPPQTSGNLYIFFIFQEERESDVVTNSNLGSRPKPPRKDVTNTWSRVFRVVHVDRDLCRFRNGHGARTRERTVSIDVYTSTIRVCYPTLCLEIPGNPKVILYIII